MSKDYTKELNEMYHLMNYGMNEQKKTTANQGIIEYSQLGADGKTYGIMREGAKYYVKVAPKKNTAILAEDYDYVGGFMNRKAYDSYTKASNALNLQLISINEANGSKTPVKSQYTISENAEWQTPQTKEARAELNRFYQLISNVDNLLKENVHYINKNNSPYTENPTSAPKESHEQGGKQQQIGIREKDWMKSDSQVNSENEYNKYGVNGNSPSGKYNAANGIKDIDATQGDPYQDTAKTSKEQGKSISEGRKVKLSEEQKRKVLAWNHDRAFVNKSSDDELDRSHGTHIKDTAPWTESPTCNNCVFEVEFNDATDIDDEEAYTNAAKGIDSDLGDTSYDGLTQDIDDNELNSDATDLFDILTDIPDTDETDETEYEIDTDDNIDDEENHLNEDVLNDFGKHPAYRKKPMTLPKNGDGSEWGRDWNDESTKGELPYGKQIGHSGDPFTEFVDTIADSIAEVLNSKKKN